MSYRGINYGPLTNIDLKTQIRYGVIPHHEVGAAWYDESELIYPQTCCPECISDNIENDVCQDCGYELSDADIDLREPTACEFDQEGYLLSQDLDSPDIFVLKSPYYTYAQFCSPCAPGACYLTSPLDVPHEDNKCYCLGHDWFEDGKAPYPVYSVDTGERISK